ncbi:hypothetical protein DFJ73DRAFT_758527 [Zopfochytrium polystomum]|nr:hypothetical protein DFJ73DRAFT_758527 [Zopfochytrium polystomum]
MFDHNATPPSSPLTTTASTGLLPLPPPPPPPPYRSPPPRPPSTLPVAAAAAAVVACSPGSSGAAAAAAGDGASPSSAAAVPPSAELLVAALAAETRGRSRLPEPRFERGELQSGPLTTMIILRYCWPPVGPTRQCRSPCLQASETPPHPATSRCTIGVNGRPHVTTTLSNEVYVQEKAAAVCIEILDREIKHASQEPDYYWLPRVSHKGVKHRSAAVACCGSGRCGGQDHPGC